MVEKKYFHIKSPGDGAFRLKVMDNDGQSVGKLFLAGPNASVQLECAPGDYKIIVDEVGTEGRLDGLYKVRLDNPNNSVELKLDNQSVANLVMKRSSPASLAQYAGFRPSLAGSMSRNSKTSHDYSVPVRHILRDDLTTFRQSKNSEQKRFTIGLSHDVETESRGGWVPATELIKTDLIPVDNHSFRIPISEWPAPLLENGRIRLSVAVEGHPTLRVPLPMFYGGIDVEFARTSDRGKVDFVSRIIAHASDINALVMALDKMTRNEAQAVLAWAGKGAENAIGFLAGKKNDPWAATAAALLLIRIHRAQDHIKWIFNLAHVAHHISDAHVAAAWATALSAQSVTDHTEEVLLGHLVKARKNGAVTFSIANTMAIDLLKTLSLSAKNAEYKSLAKYELHIWQGRTMRRMLSGPYMLWEQAGPKLQTGNLPNERYRILAQGTIDDRGYKLN